MPESFLWELAGIKLFCCLLFQLTPKAWASPPSSLREGRKLTLIPPVLQNNCPHSYPTCWPVSSPITWGLLKLLSALNCQGSSRRGIIFLLVADHAMVMKKLPWQWAGFQVFFPVECFLQKKWGFTKTWLISWKVLISMYSQVLPREKKKLQSFCFVSFYFASSFFFFFFFTRWYVDSSEF